MIDFLALLSIGTVMLVALISPGPDFVVVSKTALTQGRRAGIGVALGIALGVALYALIAMTGLSFVLAKMAWLDRAIRLVGGAYLVWIAWQVWKGAAAPMDMAAEGVQTESFARAVRLGLITNLTNAKAVAFFSSVFALVVGPDVTSATKISACFLVFSLALGWFALVATGFATQIVRERYSRFKKIIDRAAATVMGLFGLRLMLSVRE